MAADSRERETAFRHFGRRIVRAARAVIRRSRRCAHRLVEYRFLGFEKCEARFDQIALMEARDAPGNDPRDLRDGEIRLRRQKPFAAL